jgi:hypothetical protein
VVYQAGHASSDQNKDARTRMLAFFDIRLFGLGPMVLLVPEARLTHASRLAWCGRYQDGYRDVKELDGMEVDVLLLNFSDLSEEQQGLFLEALNTYLFVSPSQRRQLRLRWGKSREELSRVFIP